jgi:alanyl-tRNA synthetase
MAGLLDGGGGGGKGFAQGGGPKVEALDQALDEGRRLAKEAIGR